MLGARIIVVAFASGLLAAVAASACVAPSLDACHQRMVEEFGCCSLCDPDCRGAIAGACADDVHDPPIDENAAQDLETSSGSGGADDGERPAP